MADEHDDWDETEREALRSMAQAPPPPEVLERVLDELGRSGRLGSRRLAAWTLAAAASVAFFVGGFLLGERRATPAGDPRPRYLLLLYDATASTPQEEAARVSEYGAWARRLGAAGHLKAGEKLKDEAFTLGPAARPPDDERLGGYFLVAAADLEQALAIARECPHLRHGGRVVLRPIDPV